MLELSDHKDAHHEIAVLRRTWCAGGLQGDRFLGLGGRPLMQRELPFGVVVQFQ
jgi:hypothetical protein